MKATLRWLRNAAITLLIVVGLFSFMHSGIRGGIMKNLGDQFYADDRAPWERAWIKIIPPDKNTHLEKVASIEECREKSRAVPQSHVWSCIVGYYNIWPDISPHRIETQ